MILEDKMISVGKIKKPHGYKGELGIETLFEKVLYTQKGVPFFVKMDNILVPFFVEKIGGGPNGMSFIKFKDVNSDADAAIFSRKELYAEKTLVSDILKISEEELEDNNDFLLGYEVVDTSSSETIGKVVEISEGVEYDYLIVEKYKDGGIIEIPALDEFIEEIIDEEDEGSGTVKVILPEGFLEI